jgi:methylated-DNA-[protein]-cysteine S-methyltransferase
MWTTMDSPVGELRLVATDGSLTAIDFLDLTPGLRSNVAESASVARSASRAGALPEADRVDDDWLLGEAACQLRAYFDRDLKEFDLPLAPQGTPFQVSVWSCLQEIGYGEAISYGEVARRLGIGPRGARAVGVANGRNPVPIVIPCHRVVGANGALVGYGGGMQRKRLLLTLEQQTLI